MNRRHFLLGSAALAAASVVEPARAGDLPRQAILPAEFVSNPTLPTYGPAGGWPSTPVDAKGRFMNHEFPFRHSLADTVKMLVQPNPQAAESRADPQRVPVVRKADFLRDSNDVLVWLGHASFYLRLGGVAVLIDPIFGNLPINKRLSALPVDPALFTQLDYVLVSHAHYDHCDQAALTQLHRQNPTATILTGLGLDARLRRWLQQAPIQPAGWYQQYRTNQELTVSYVPARHWANRSLADVNETLWDGFVIQGHGKTVYFGGDSGYGGHFRQVGELFPTIGVAILGAGAYAPRWFMAPNHMDPAQTIQAFHDTGARQLVPMHFGTFALTDEPPGEADRLLRAAEVTRQLHGRLCLGAIGEPLLL